MPRSKDDGFEAYWLNEKDWLVDIVGLFGPFDQEQLDYIGRLFAFSLATDARFLAQIGDPEGPRYELWFSFNSDNQKQKFLQMVRDDGYADPDEETCFFAPSSLGDLPDLRPIAKVFPKAQCDHIMAVATATAAMMALDSNHIN